MSNRAVHSARLERWLGAAEVEKVSRDMRSWYGPPIAVAGVPGTVYVGRDGDFCGDLRAGWECSKMDRAVDVLRRMKNAYRLTVRDSHSQMNAGFSSLADMVRNYNNGETRVYQFDIGNYLRVIGASYDLYNSFSSDLPAQGTAAPAAPGGRSPTSADGGFTLQEPTETNAQQYLVRGNISSGTTGGSTTNGGSYLLYDRIFDVAKAASSTATQAVTGTLTRYTSTTSGAQDSAEGNFLMVSARTTLGATSHNWTVCTYTDQSGNTGATLPSITGISGCDAKRIDHPLHFWFAPLAAGDTGILALTQMQCSASVTGGAEFVIGHPIAWLPCPISILVCEFEYTRTAFHSARIFNGACLNFIEVAANATAAMNYYGTFTTVSS